MLHYGDLLAYKNKEDQRAAERRWYAKNSDKIKAKTAKRRKEIHDWYIEFKSTLVCSRCGENHPACIEFHHVDKAEKEYNISQMGISGFSRERILEEMSKCIILCSNCHRKEHYELNDMGL